MPLTRFQIASCICFHLGHQFSKFSEVDFLDDKIFLYYKFGPSLAIINHHIVYDLLIHKMKKLSRFPKEKKFLGHYDGGGGGGHGPMASPIYKPLPLWIFVLSSVNIYAKYQTIWVVDLGNLLMSESYLIYVPWIIIIQFLILLIYICMYILYIRICTIYIVFYMHC